MKSSLQKKYWVFCGRLEFINTIREKIDAVGYFKPAQKNAVAITFRDWLANKTRERPINGL